MDCYSSTLILLFYYYNENNSNLYALLNYGAHAVLLDTELGYDILYLSEKGGLSRICFILEWATFNGYYPFLPLPQCPVIIIKQQIIKIQ